MHRFALDGHGQTKMGTESASSVSLPSLWGISSGDHQVTIRKSDPATSLPFHFIFSPATQSSSTLYFCCKCSICTTPLWPRKEPIATNGPSWQPPLPVGYCI